MNISTIAQLNQKLLSGDYVRNDDYKKLMITIEIYYDAIIKKKPVDIKPFINVLLGLLVKKDKSIHKYVLTILRQILFDYCNEITVSICREDVVEDILPLPSVFTHEPIIQRIKFVKKALSLVNSHQPNQQIPHIMRELNQYYIWLTGIKIYLTTTQFQHAIDTLLHENKSKSTDSDSMIMMKKTCYVHAHLIRAQYHSLIGNVGYALGHFNLAEMNGYKNIANDKYIAMANMLREENSNFFNHHVPALEAKELKLITTEFFIPVDDDSDDDEDENIVMNLNLIKR